MCVAVAFRSSRPWLSTCTIITARDVLVLRAVSFLFSSSRVSSETTGYSGKTRTFKPRKDVPEGTKQWQLRKYAEATLVRTQETRCYFFRFTNPSVRVQEI